MAYVAGCYFHIPSPNYNLAVVKHYLPRVESSTHTQILSTTSRTRLIQQFVNPGETAIAECIYTFPLYDGVSVVSFTCRVGEKVLHGLVKERAQAQAIYEEAVASGETAGLMDQALEASDVFSTKLGNIPAGATVQVEIDYIGELKHDAESEGIRFTVPVAVAARYGSRVDAVAVAGAVPVKEGGMRITVDASMAEGSPIQGISSPSHPIAVTMGTLSKAPEEAPSMSKASATLALQNATLDTDFVLIVRNKDTGTPRAYLESHATIAHQRALMLSLVPKFSLPSIRPEIVFVADRSGSMADKIPTLVSAMKIFLKSMPTGVCFNICSFGSEDAFLWPQSKRYTSESLAQANQHLDTFDANMGGTETLRAVKSTIERRLTDLPLEVILLTDGDIWQQEEFFHYLRNQVSQSRDSIRLFPLGIGSGVSSALIEGAARAGNGFAQMVQDGERMDNRIVRMLKGALTSHVSNYRLEIKYSHHGADDDDFEMIDKVTDGMEILDVDKMAENENKRADQATPISLFDAHADPDKMDEGPKDPLAKLHIPISRILQAPHDIPALSPFSRTTVYLLLSPETNQTTPTSVVLRGKSSAGPLELEIPVEVLSDPAETIHQLAARKAVQDLEEGRHWIADGTGPKEELLRKRFPSLADDLVKREAVRLGTQFQVMNRWCSFVAVASNDKEIFENSKAQSYTPQSYTLQSNTPQSQSSQSIKWSGGAGIGGARRFASPTLFSAPGGASPRYRSAGAPGGTLGPGPFFDTGLLPPPPAPTVRAGKSSQQGGVFGAASTLFTKFAAAPAYNAAKPSASYSAYSGSSYAANEHDNDGDDGEDEEIDDNAPTPAPVPLTIPETVHALIALQAFDGWWDPATTTTTALARLLQLSELELRAHGADAPASAVAAGRAWASLLVLAWLADKAAAEEEVWELVAEKARAWLGAVEGDELRRDVGGVWAAEAKALVAREGS